MSTIGAGEASSQGRREESEFREALPRTSSGKGDRAALVREQHELESAGDGRPDKR